MKPVPPPPTVEDRLSEHTARDGWIAGAARTGRVVRLVDVYRADIDALIADVGRDLPVILAYCGPQSLSARGVVDEILDAIEQIVVSTAPAWLGFDESAGIDVADAEDRARDLAAIGADYRPFVVELARAAATGSPCRSHQSPELRARGLVRLLRHGYGRDTVILAVTAPPDLDRNTQDVVAAGVGWVAEHGDLPVWLPADTLPDVTRCSTVRGRFRSSPAAAPGPVSEPAEPSPQVMSASRLEGMPAPHSIAEQTLERALRRHQWAHDRRWNRRLDDIDPMAPTAIVDVHWPRARVVVEVDGDDHRQPGKYAADRARDNILQRHGFIVLRYPNAQVLTDVGLVVDEIRQVLADRVVSAPVPDPVTRPRRH
ncbi:DUF559 domain-containing protein [Gordonia sp. LSe1-13]|uniref:DUF559 domain-containing protein n=1 Tax=Gordonia sesuvii TaxID=3116777 RepID=A0ABU7MD54_9ACTN|nr:DUF559 domain-containing protein [Gordonia sp. LSe1-13]